MRQSRVVPQYRAEFDAAVTFRNGGGLTATSFRVDVGDPDVTEAEVAELFITSLSLLMVQRVDLTALRIIEQAHKGTHAGPSDPASSVPRAAGEHRIIELSHVITAGMTTYPGLPGPEVTPHLTREQSRAAYAPGTEFTIDRVSMLGNTGTYLDTPFHRYPDGTDLAGLALSSVVDLPTVVVRAVENAQRGIGVGALTALDVRGAAVLLHTGGDAAWGTDAYAQNAAYLTADGATWLVDHGAALVGIDSVNIDDVTPHGPRPAHTTLLAAGIPIVEHLTGLDQLPALGARFTAAPARFAAFGTFPVRAFAVINSRP
jgi:kynurenine formamidase